MKKQTFYLAHHTADRKEVKKWEERLELLYDIDLINPFYDKRNALESIVVTFADKSNVGDLANLKGKFYTKEYSKMLVFNDIMHIRNTDGIVAFVSNPPSIGTSMEIFYGHYEGKKVYTIFHDSKDINMYHPWIQTCSTKVFKKKEDFEVFVKEGGLGCHT